MAYIYDLTDTWSAAGTVFNGIKLNVTNTASAAASKLVTLQIGGTEHFSVTKDGVGYFSGNLGVGTSSFTNTVNNFVVRQSGTGVDLGGSASTAAIRVRGTSGGAGLIDFYPVSSDPNSSPFYLGRIFYDNASNFMSLHTNSAERMRIDSSGNVGIGTSSPIAGGLLTVGSGAGSSGTTQFLNAGSGGSALVGRISGSNTWFIGDTVAALGSGSGLINFIYGANPWIVYLNNAERMRIDSSGNVGVGVTPSAWGGSTALQLKNASLWSVNGREARVSQNLYYDGANYKYITTNPASMLMAYDNEFQFYRAASGTAGTTASLTETMRIDSSGNLLVGTTSSGYGGRFVAVKNGGDVVYAAQTASGGYCYKSNAANNGGNYYHMEFQENGTARGSISSNGSVVLYNTTSDVRLKYNIENADDASSLIDAIQVRKFDWKSNGSHQRHGFIAQELIEVAPEAVSQPEDPDGMMAVDYSKLVPMLVKELQSVRARLAQLEGN